MIGRLVSRHLLLRPVRSAVFVGAYAIGVSVMLALLSIGEVMVEQARDEEWVGGGEITVVPEGVDLETLRMGGAIYFGIEQARFLARQVLAGPRLADRVAAVAPWIDDRALYLRLEGSDAAVAVRASGQVPSAARALGAAPDLMSGVWQDSDADRRWLRPSQPELYSEIDRFHLPPERVRGDTTWAEWHYFNLLWPESESWLYLSFIVGGDITGERWGGQLLARYRTPAGVDLVFSDTAGPSSISFSQASPDLAFGSSSVRLDSESGRYRVLARIPSAEGTVPAMTLDLVIDPAPHRFFPPAELAATDSMVSGYVVAALRARASGSICLGQLCVRADEAIAYHDHNWGTWGGVVWDWGVAHVGDLDVLYGGVHGEAAAAAPREVPFLVYIVDSLGVVANLELEELEYSGARPTRVQGTVVDVPEQLAWTARRGPDSVSARIEIKESSLTHLTLGGDSDLYFAQMYGTMTLEGMIGGRRINETGPGFFETYIR